MSSAFKVKPALTEGCLYFSESKKLSLGHQDGDTDSLEQEEEKKKKKRLRIPGLSSSKVEKIKTC